MPQLILMWSTTHTHKSCGETEATLRMEKLTCVGNSSPQVTAIQCWPQLVITILQRESTCRITHTCQLTALQFVGRQSCRLDIEDSNLAQVLLFELATSDSTCFALPWIIMYMYCKSSLNCMSEEENSESEMYRKRVKSQIRMAYRHKHVPQQYTTYIVIPSPSE